MSISIPSDELDALHRRQNSEVLAITAHVQLNPLRISFLGADGELRTYAADQGPASSGPPAAQRISISGFDANVFGQLGAPP